MAMTLKPKKGRQVRSKAMVLLSVFLNWKDVLHYEFLPQRSMFNKEYCRKVMRRLCVGLLDSKTCVRIPGQSSKMDDN